MNVLEKARSIHAALAAGGGSSAKLGEDWALVGRLLPRLGADVDRAGKLVADRDVAALGVMLDEIEGKVSSPKAVPVQAFAAEEMSRALRAFMKQLKVTRLDDESKLGGRYTSGGRVSKIAAMRPPEGFPEGVWPALVRAGKLKDLGGGFYGEG